MGLETSLYRKYRPTRFGDIVGQEPVKTTLRHAFIHGRLPHAFLFTGSRGSGKTSTAKILARVVNCENPDMGLGEPCNECQNCLESIAGTHPDIKEQDAASERGIDKIKALISELSFNPGLGRVSVTILDEAHALTPDAFNALLKTIEEPPPGVMFILVTTEAGKIPETISSRCQEFQFRPISAVDTADAMTRVAGLEGIGITESGARAIASESEGSLRDALGLLQQLRDYASDSDITPAVVSDFLGTTSTLVLSQAIDLVVSRDLPAILGFVGDVLDGGADPVQLFKDLQKHVRRVFLISVDEKNRKAMEVTPDEFSTLQKQAKALGTRRCLEIMEVCGRTLYRLNTNASARLVTEAAMSYMAYPEYDGTEAGIKSSIVSMSESMKRLAKMVDILSAG